MSKFKENDKVVVTAGPYAGLSGTVERTVPSYGIRLNGGEFIACYESSLKFEDIMNEPIDEYVESDFSVDDYYAEMASIAYYKGLNIAYNDETDYLGIAYFKVYDHDKIRSSKRVARLHFKDSGMEYHKDTLGKQPWALNSGDIKKIKNLLKGVNKTNPSYNNWQVLCFDWNYDNKLLPMGATINEYFDGKYDNQHFNDTRLENAYVPSTQEMPDTWIYDPSKGKK